MVMIRYSLKQLGRMKRVCILFVLFLTSAVLLLSLGSSLYGLAAANRSEEHTSELQSQR